VVLDSVAAPFLVAHGPDEPAGLLGQVGEVVRHRPLTSAPSKTRPATKRSSGRGIPAGSTGTEKTRCLKINAPHGRRSSTSEQDASPKPPKLLAT
jgi:hypothetical protein